MRGIAVRRRRPTPRPTGDWIGDRGPDDGIGAASVLRVPTAVRGGGSTVKPLGRVHTCRSLAYV